MMPGGCCGTKKPKLANGKTCQDDWAPRSSSTTQQCPSAHHNGCCNGTGMLDVTSSSSSGAGPSSLLVGMRLGLLGQKPLRFASIDMAVYCFDVLHSYLHKYDPPKLPGFPNDQFPLFVTWKVGKEKKLRGCIGTFTSTSLHQGLREYAITSACKDSRFDPVTADDFSRLHCSISLLLDFEVAEHYLDWQIGVHGIRIEFNNDKGSKKAATYLPEVSHEQGWNHIQTIDSLLRKGGFKGTITPEIRTSVCLVRFQSEKIGISYAEYVSHKNGSTTNGYCLPAHDPAPSSSSSLAGGSGAGQVRNGFHQQQQPPPVLNGGYGLRRPRLNSNAFMHQLGGAGGSPPPPMQPGGTGFRLGGVGRAGGSCVNLPGAAAGSGSQMTTAGRASPHQANRHTTPPFSHPYRPPI